jgi:hypothetical protein
MSQPENGQPSLDELLSTEKRSRYRSLRRKVREGEMREAEVEEEVEEEVGEVGEVAVEAAEASRRKRAW